MSAFADWPRASRSRGESPVSAPSVGLGNAAALDANIHLQLETFHCLHHDKRPRLPSVQSTPPFMTNALLTTTPCGAGYRRDTDVMQPQCRSPFFVVNQSVDR